MNNMLVRIALIRCLCRRDVLIAVGGWVGALVMFQRRLKLRILLFLVFAQVVLCQGEEEIEGP